MDLSQEISIHQQRQKRTANWHTHTHVACSYGQLKECEVEQELGHRVDAESGWETVWTTVTLSNNNMINRYVDDPLLPRSDAMHHLQ